MDYKIEDIVDPEEYFFWINLCSKNYSDKQRSDKNILINHQKNDLDSEWLQEYELIYKSHKMENY